MFSIYDKTTKTTKEIGCQEVIVISPDNGGWDVTAWDSNGNKVKTAWGYTTNDAYQKAQVIQDYYRDYQILMIDDFRYENHPYKQYKLSH